MRSFRESVSDYWRAGASQPSRTSGSDFSIYIQWNLPKTDTIGTERCVHFMEGVLYWEVFAIGHCAYVS